MRILRNPLADVSKAVLCYRHLHRNFQQSLLILFSRSQLARIVSRLGEFSLENAKANHNLLKLSGNSMYDLL
jgi:ABC-type phosphate/phosphonate transport system ATPase subunit